MEGEQSALEQSSTEELNIVSPENQEGNNTTRNNEEVEIQLEQPSSFQQSPQLSQPQVQLQQLSQASQGAPETVPQKMDAETARNLSAHLIHSYFTTQTNPLTRHHIESYDQFIYRDMKAIIASHNPLILLKNPKNRRDAADYKYKIEIYIGGEQSNEIFVGIPTITLDQGNDVRILFPNEARLRNLSYALQITANILVRITVKDLIKDPALPSEDFTKDIVFERQPICKMPLMLHSSYCILRGKPSPLLQQMGECPQDQGGYFIIDGSEKVLVTRQEGAFNTLWITEQKADPNVHYYSSISCLNPKSREVKRVSFYWTREQLRPPRGFGSDKTTKPSIYKQSLLEVSIPYIIKPIPIFVLFRAMGVQSDKAILQLIFPDFQNPESSYLADLLIPSINAASPFLDTYSAVQYIKSLTKHTGEGGGIGEARVLDVIHSHLFPHVEDLPFARISFLAECVRKILRVVKHIDTPASRDDTRNQRLLTSGFLCQMLFQNIYNTYVKAVKLNIDKKYSYNESTYANENFVNLFGESDRRQLFLEDHITTGLMRGFKGKWAISANKEESGLLQELDRLSYLNFTSHLRHVILNFDTGMKLQGPRRLNPSQYGYFCTSETPSGSSIGITKNLSIMTAISTGSYPDALRTWLFQRGSVVECEYITPSLATLMVPVYMNSGIIGYTTQPKQLARVLRLLKRSGYLPPLSSSGFNIPDRKVSIYIDDGRPLRPLIVCDPRGQLPSIERFKGTWRDFIVGTLRPNISISSQEFTDPLADRLVATLTDYLEFFEKEKDKLAVIEYLDPYEQNEALIANWPEHIMKETTHMEVHPSTILGLLGNMIPYPNHNQSPRNQLSASQSKQGISIYATNWKNRFDNTANILCYGQAPLSRTIYQDYIGDGQMSYGQNIILAMGMYGGYNQEDGIIMNADALARGQFRSINYRSYETFEEDDKKTQSETRIGNPKNIPEWLDIKVSNDYSLLDEEGIIQVGSYVTQTTVLVAKYISNGGKMKDASLTPQVWTRGRVESVVVTVNNAGLRLVKIRVVQDRVPELGDKFCLTPDHDVLTKTGWKPITDITIHDSVAQLNKESSTIEYVQPLETFVFDHSGEMYEIRTIHGTQLVTGDHKVLIKSKDIQKKYTFITASLLYTLQHNNYEMIDKSFTPCPIRDIIRFETNPIGDKVYCISVPSEVFLVRRRNEMNGLWTGNSNRHGQKGTINVLYRAHDMPRTAEGITPDMIMNPTAIPSRMTIGQILEMILGNVSAHLGAIGNCTAFMNDGSPHEALGAILEGLGLNKMSNQVLYNGMTGEQMTADIFMGVVYGMRLKHMTEDKWNARGTGRKEQRTHQPTGGRGNEGGLKIGEMERDAILGHGISSFIQESYTTRSDGAIFTICNGCGTVPIYNERENLHICPLCDGPIKFSGDTANTLDPIPPAKRSSVTFSKVQMPYATNLFFQEMNTFMNMGARVLTSREPMRLKGLDRVEDMVNVDLEGVSQPLVPRVIPEISVPPLPENPPAATTEQISEELAKLNTVAVNDTLNTVNTTVNTLQPLQSQTQQDIQLAPGSFNTVQQTQQQFPIMQQQPSIEPMAVTTSGIPIINIDTSPNAMEQSGLTQPRDATSSINLPQQQQPQQSSRRRVTRLQPQQPQQPQQLQQLQQQQQQQQQQNQEQEPPKQQYAQQVSVEKLG